MKLQGCARWEAGHLPVPASCLLSCLALPRPCGGQITLGWLGLSGIWTPGPLGFPFLSDGAPPAAAGQVCDVCVRVIHGIVGWTVFTSPASGSSRVEGRTQHTHTHTHTNTHPHTQVQLTLAQPVELCGFTYMWVCFFSKHAVGPLYPWVLHP